jgi:hypothetical protein
MTKSTTRTDEAPTATVETTPAPTVEPVAADQPTLKEGGVYLELLPAVEDGEVTFTRPGVEAFTFTAKDGRVRASEEEAAWLVANSVARYPAAAE